MEAVVRDDGVVRLEHSRGSRPAARLPNKRTSVAKDHPARQLYAKDLLGALDYLPAHVSQVSRLRVTRRWVRGPFRRTCHSPRTAIP